LLRAAQASSRGTILSLTHYGPLSGRKTMLLAASPMVTVAGEWLFDSWPKGYQGYWYRHTVRLGPYPGVTTLPVRGSREALAAELKAGGTAMIAMDMPGRTTTTYLGKPVEMTTGSARLAVDTDSRILPFSLVPHRRDRWRVLIGEPLLPEDHGSWEALHQATADWHSEVILRAPEYYEDPRRPTGWPEATRDRWPAPAH
jgi:lauroyl/myristoyl acyltransferase